TLVFTNASDTAAQLTGQANFTAPAGATEGTPVKVTTTSVAGNATAVWTLTVNVDDSASDGQTIIQDPGSIQYAMSAISLPAGEVPITPSSVTSTVDAPSADLEVVSATSENGRRGRTIITITFRNNGPAAARGAVVTLAGLDYTGLSFVSSTLAGLNTCGVTSCGTSASTQIPSGPTEYLLVVELTAGADRRGTATIDDAAGVQVDPEPTNNSAPIEIKAGKKSKP
ncbi:MAG TPA: hypothetical protein VFD59_02995, partial [Nocardioidaceae bacterium]|nr:hypothetical protein [Nocardioidaceae bacterium]